MSKGYSLKPSSEHTTSHLDFLQIDVLPVRHHWQKVRIGEIGEVVGGSTPSTKIDEYWNGEIPWLTPSEVSHEHNLFLSKTERYLTRAGLESTSLRLLPPGTVMMTSRATIGAVGINIVPMATNQGFINIICDPEKVDNVFLAYWIRYHRPEIEARAKGTTFKEISRSSFKSMELLLPPLHEQRAIARVLRAVQAVMQALRRELELERERKAALMHHLFRYGTRGEPTKQTEIGEIPQSWEVKPLGSLLREPLKNGYSAPESEEDEGIRTLTLSAVTQNDFSIRNTKKTRANEHKVKDLWLQPGDIFIERANTSELVGLAAIYEGPPNFAIYPDLLIRVRLIGNRIIPRFALEALLTDYSRSYFRKHARGTAGNMPKIDHAIVQRCPLPLPPLEEQEEIASISLLCDQQIALIEQELALYQELFRALLEELMSGRLSVQPLLEQEQATDAAEGSMHRG